MKEQLKGIAKSLGTAVLMAVITPPAITAVENAIHKVRKTLANRRLKKKA